MIIPLALPVSLVQADDAVFRLARDGRTRVRSVGQIIDFTGEALILRHRSGREERIPPDQVLDLSSDWTPLHIQGDAHFEAQAFDQALASYLEAMRTEKRAWVRRLILSRCVWCYRRLGRVDRAVGAFLAIFREDPRTPYFGAIPLNWMTGQASHAVETHSRQWIQLKENPAAHLIGASWLLSTPDRATAIATLRELAVSPYPEVAFLAEAQLWRTQIVTATPSDAQRWAERIQRMPQAIQPGPDYVLGQLQARQGQRNVAALSFLRVPILFPEQHELAAASLFSAAEQLDQMDQRYEAERLLAEIIADFPNSATATRARQRWKSLQQNLGKGQAESE